MSADYFVGQNGAETIYTPTLSFDAVGEAMTVDESDIATDAELIHELGARLNARAERIDELERREANYRQIIDDLHSLRERDARRRS